MWPLVEGNEATELQVAPYSFSLIKKTKNNPNNNDSQIIAKLCLQFPLIILSY